MRYIFVRDYLKEIGIELTKEDLAWFEIHSKGHKDLERYLLLYALFKYKDIKTGLEIGCAGCWASMAMIHGGAERVLGIDIKPKIISHEKLEVIKGDSKEVLPDYIEKGIKFDLVFVDGNHDLDNVKVDLDMAEKLATKYIVIHDYNLESGVTPAVDNKFGKPELIIQDNLCYPDLEAGIVLIKL